VTTWGELHAGDKVRGADQRVWAVVERLRAPRWAVAGEYGKFRLARGDGNGGPNDYVDVSKRLADGVELVEGVDHSAERRAVDAFVEVGMTVEIIEEQLMSVAVDVPGAPSGMCQHPAEARSVLQDGRKICTACQREVPWPDVPGAPQAVTEAPLAPDGSNGGGAVLTGVSVTPKPGELTDPAPVKREPPRGKYGWYKLPHPMTGVEDIWPRVSTISKTLADESGLTRWKMRMAIAGVARRQDLIAAAAAADPNVDKSKLDEIVESALERSETGAKANYGTAVHKFAERLDAGETVSMLQMPPVVGMEVEAYARALKAHGLTVLPELSERVIVNEDAGYAGQWDRVVRDRAGVLYALDLKTGQDLSYSWLEFVTQLALYSRGRWLCQLDYIAYEPMPPIDQAKGLILHLPFGKARGEIYGVDLMKGWAAAEVALRARSARSDSKNWAWLVKPESPTDVVRLHLDRAETLDELRAVQANAVGRGIWTDELTAHALGRYDLIRARTATREGLAALWAELQPVGRWTEVVDSAAHARKQQLSELANV
jgi:hypothetical protein